MLDLFVAYSRQSESEVRGLLEDLAALGDTVSVAPEPHVGTAWWDQALSRVRACDAMLFVLAPRTLESEACLRQIRYAQALGKQLLAIELSDQADLVSVPVLLSGVRFVSYRRRDRDGVLRLCRTLRSLGKTRPLPAVLPAPPEPPPADLGPLRDRIVAAGKLDVHQQMALIAELARDSRDVHVGADCRQLLLALRRRRDLSPSAIVDIDALLRKTASTRINMRRSALLAPPSRAPRALSAPSREEPSLLRPSLSHGLLQAGPMSATHMPSSQLATLGRLLGILGVLLVAVVSAWLVAVRLRHESFAELSFGDLGLSSGELGGLLGVGAGVFGLLSLVMLRRSPAATRTSSATR
jgi:hypothetical protein